MSKFGKNLKRFVDISDYRLGDRMAGAWYAQTHRLQTGEQLGVIDHNERLIEHFDLAKYFPQTFCAITQEDIEHLELSKWDQGNLWLTATNEFHKSPRDGFFEYLPEKTIEQANNIRAQVTYNRPRVLIHILDDAPYNKRRNWLRKDAYALTRQLERAGCEVILLNPSQGKFCGNYEYMLAQMLASDMFIGGDTGPSHVFAMLCPEKPQLAIYPNMSKDRIKFKFEQEKLALPISWTSLPLKKNISTIEMEYRRKLAFSNGKLQVLRYGIFNVNMVASVAISLLYQKINAI